MSVLHIQRDVTLSDSASPNAYGLIYNCADNTYDNILGNYQTDFVIGPLNEAQRIFPSVAIAFSYLDAAAGIQLCALASTFLGGSWTLGNVYTFDPNSVYTRIMALENNITRTVTPDTRTLTTSTGASGFQISATKNSTVRYTVGTSTTATIGGGATSGVILEMCPTNSAVASDWVEVGRAENVQTITLAVSLQSLQVQKEQLTADVPAGYYVKLRSYGTGTHTETFVSGQKTIYG